MKEVKNDIWSLWEKGYFIVIPTNGIVKKNGENVMGKGLALQAKNKFPTLPKSLGAVIKLSGNVVVRFNEWRIITFPTKHDWREKASLELIERSCIDLVNILDVSGTKTPVYIPKVGCGYGNLDWEDVKPILERCLDDRFVIVKDRG